MNTSKAYGKFLGPAYKTKDQISNTSSDLPDSLMAALIQNEISICVMHSRKRTADEGCQYDKIKDHHFFSKFDLFF